MLAACETVRTRAAQTCGGDRRDGCSRSSDCDACMTVSSSPSSYSACGRLVGVKGLTGAGVGFMVAVERT